MTKIREDHTKDIIESLKNTAPLYKKLCASVANHLLNHFKEDKEGLQYTSEDIAQYAIMGALKKIKEGVVIDNLEDWCTTVSKSRTLEFLDIIISLKDTAPLYKKLSARVANLLFEHFKEDKESLQHNSEDIVRDTIITALAKFKEGIVINNIEAWCTTVSKNKALDFLKKKKATRLPEFNDTEGSEKGSKNFNKLEKIFEDKVNNESSYIKVLTGQCMKQLSENYRKVLALTAVGNKTREIAENLNIPQNTILTWVTKAKKQFSVCMGFNR